MMTRTRMSIGLLPLLLLLLPVLAGCGREAAGELPDAALLPQEVVVHARDYVFEAPDTISGGPTTIRLINEGPDFHHVWLVRLAPGRTMAELMAYLAEGHHVLPSWAVDVGGPNTPGAPGEETSATVDLRAGDYVLICVIPSMTDGVLHIMKGMVRPLTVVEPRVPVAAMPSADLVMTLDDYSFITDRPIVAGRHTIRVENDAPQPHEVIFVKLEPGRTAMDFVNFVTRPEGAPPGRIIGGTTGIARGEVNLVTLDFEAGDYALLCFVPDAADGAPHLAHGMIHEFRVE